MLESLFETYIKISGAMMKSFGRMYLLEKC